MDTLLNLLLNWGYSNPGALYTGSGDPVYVDSAQWRALSLTSVGLTLAIVAAGVAACYLLTRRVGQAFVLRWWLFALIVALASGCAVFLYLSSAVFVWDDQANHLPALVAFLRALLSTLQGGIYFYLLSGLGCLVFGRFLGVRPFVDNRRIPIPHVL